MGKHTCRSLKKNLTPDANYLLCASPTMHYSSWANALIVAWTKISCHRLLRLIYLMYSRVALMLFVLDEHSCSSLKKIWKWLKCKMTLLVIHNALFVLDEHARSSLKKFSRVAHSALFVLDEHTCSSVKRFSRHRLLQLIYVMYPRVALRLFVLDEHSCSSLKCKLFYWSSTMHCSSWTNTLVVAWKIYHASLTVRCSSWTNTLVAA